MRKIALNFNEKKLILVLRDTPTADKIPTIAMTTKSSTNVNPELLVIINFK